jgi:hypothetical protein
VLPALGRVGAGTFRYGAAKSLESEPVLETGRPDAEEVGRFSSRDLRTVCCEGSRRMRMLGRRHGASARLSSGVPDRGRVPVVLGGEFGGEDASPGDSDGLDIFESCGEIP